MTIKEIGEQYQITPDTLRYYEKVGLIDPVPRKNGIRCYGKAEQERIEFIVCMRGAGVSIDVLVRYIELMKEGDHTANERLELLKKERVVLQKKMKELQSAFDKLTYKIEVYYPAMMQGKEDKCI